MRHYSVHKSPSDCWCTAELSVGQDAAAAAEYDRRQLQRRLRHRDVINATSSRMRADKHRALPDYADDDAVDTSRQYPHHHTTLLDDAMAS